MAQQHFRKIPRFITARLARIPAGNPIRVGGVLVLTKEGLGSGAYDHLQIKSLDGELIVPAQITPSIRSGRASFENMNGREIVRRDLPKEQKSTSILAPSWGDWSKGTHVVDLPYERYPREYVPPRQLTINMKLLTEPLTPTTIGKVAFNTEQVLDPLSQSFKADLLFNLNLAQENFRHADVHLSDQPLETYQSAQRVHWEILPPGHRDENIARIIGRRDLTPAERKVITDRYDFMESLKPEAMITGTSGFNRYFGAKLSDKLVIFENANYGNAIYVLGNDWEALTQKSRSELMDMNNPQVVRITHTRTWKGRVRLEIARRGHRLAP